MRPSMAIVLLLLVARPAAAGTDIPGDTVQTPHFSRLVITADQDSSTVVLDGQVAGSTPLAIDSVAPGSHTLTVISRNPSSWFSRRDSLFVTLLPGDERHLRFSVLSPIRLEPVAIVSPSPFLSDLEARNGRTIALFASGGIAVAAGVAAAYFKISADERNESYLATGNPALLEERRHLDTAAGIAFVATQVSFAILSYLLLTE